MVKKLSIAISEPPPQSKDGLNAEMAIRSIYHGPFENFYNKLADHYNSRFEWLGDMLAGKVADIGIGQGGAEAFALMWALEATEAVGFDNELSHIKNAERNRKSAHDLVHEALPRTLSVSNPDYKNELEAWYREKVLQEIRDSRLPTFVPSDVVRGVEWESNYFDLVYSRYVLDKTEEAVRNIALQEMVRIVRPGGLIVVVAPESALPKSGDLDKLGTALMRMVGKDKLGKLEIPGDDLKGVIYMKKNAGDLNG